MNRQPTDSKIRNDLADSAKKVSDSLRDLSTLIQSASAAASLGIKELETSRKEIVQVIEGFQSLNGNNQAGNTFFL